MNVRNRKEKNSALELGDHIKDKISGFEGVVTSISEYIAGCKRIGVTPMELKSDGTPIDIQSFDEPNLEIVKKGILKSEVEEQPCQFKLGDRAEHKINGYSGVVTAITKYTSDWDYGITITPTTLVDGKPVPDHTFPSSMVKKVTEQEHKEPKGKATGGPQLIPRMIK